MEKWFGYLKNKGVLLVLVGLLLVVIMLPLEGAKGTDNNKQENGLEQMHQEQLAAYELQLEQEFCQLLEKMQGIGEVNVMLTLRNSETTGTVQEIGLFSWNSNETLYQKREGELYQVDGVAIVAQGAENPLLRKQILEAAQALFGLEAHRIAVLIRK